MTRRTRRRSGLIFLAALAVQATAAPIGACAYEHQEAEVVPHEMTAAGHAHGGEGAMGRQVDHAAYPDHAPEQDPTVCNAFAACGASAAETTGEGSDVRSASIAVHEVRRTPDHPAVIVLGLATPPPKI